MCESAFTHPTCLLGVDREKFPFTFTIKAISIIKEHLAFFSYDIRPLLRKPLEQTALFTATNHNAPMPFLLSGL
jgi:hypothetical protein